MAKLTITIDDGVLRKARMRALDQGTSVNALLREFLESFTGLDGSCTEATKTLLDLAAMSTSVSTTPRWTREELQER